MVYIISVVVLLFTTIVLSVKNYFLSLKLKNERKRLKEATDYIGDLEESAHILSKFSESIEKKKDELSQTVNSRETKDIRVEGYTGIDFLDVVLSNKLDSCKKKGIHMSVDAEKLTPFALSNTELVSLFANLLDNAIEASDRSESIHKDISISISNSGDSHLIRLSNSKSRQSHPIAEEFRTSKDNDRAHGQGHRIIESLVEKAKGTIDYKDSGDRFFVIITV